MADGILRIEIADKRPGYFGDMRSIEVRELVRVQLYAQEFRCEVLECKGRASQRRRAEHVNGPASDRQIWVCGVHMLSRKLVATMLGSVHARGEE